LRARIIASSIVIDGITIAIRAQRGINKEVAKAQILEARCCCEGKSSINIERSIEKEIGV
jgi:hypothetical protein